MRTRSKSYNDIHSEKENEDLMEDDEIIKVVADGLKINKSTELFLVAEDVNKDNTFNESLLTILTST